MKSFLPEHIEKILITGGAGFIGGNLIRKLLKESNATIYNIDKMGYASDRNFINEGFISSREKSNKNKYNFLNIDLANLEDIKSAVERIKPDAVMHLAAESHVDRSIKSPASFLSSNVFGTFNLLESIRYYWELLPSPKKENFRFHHISTDEVYGSLGEKGFFKEDTPYNPRSPYSASKASSDHFVNAWHETYGLPILVTNCSNNFGPYQFPEKLIPLAINKGLKKQSIPLYGDGHNIRDWLFVDDHIDALILVLSKGQIGENYCVGGYGEKTNKKVIEDICELLNKFTNDEFDHFNLVKKVTDRPGHDFRYAIDSSKISSQLGWEPKYNFEDALEETFNWYVDNQKWCNEMLINSKYSGERLGI